MSLSFQQTDNIIVFLRSGNGDRLLSLLEMNVYSSESIIKLQHHIIITGYGNTLYLGIVMVFVFSPYIQKFSSYFQFQDFTVQHMSKLSCVPNISSKYYFWLII